MNTHLSIARSLRTGSALAVTLLAALSVHAADAGQDTYKRVVLGDTSIAAPQAPAAAERVVPGSYARYLIRNGVDEKQALATARATGEQPTVERADERVAAEQLSGRQRYERALGLSFAG